MTKIQGNNTFNPFKWLERRSTFADEEVRRLFQLITLIHGVEPRSLRNHSTLSINLTITWPIPLSMLLLPFCCTEQQMPDVCFVLANAKAIATAATEAADDSTAVGDSYS